MAVSRNRKDHKEKVKLKQMSEQNQKVQSQKAQDQQLPLTREVPTWKSDEQLVITGLEFEYLYNFVTSVGQAYAAAQSVMNRALLSDKVIMEFDKLVTNPDGTQHYERMSPEESAPHKQDFAKLVETVKNPPKSVPQSPIQNPLQAV